MTSSSVSATSTSESAQPVNGLLGPSLIVVGVSLAINSVLGPLGCDRVDYPVTDFMMNQTIGLDVANPLVVAPVFVGLGLLARSRPTLAAALALGPTAYVAHMFVQYVAGPDHLSYPPVLLLQLGLFMAGWLLAAVAWLGVRPWPAEVVPSGVRAAVALALAAFVARGLRLGRSWAEPAFLGLLTWYALVTVAVLAMAVTLVVNDDRYASTGQLILFMVVAAIVVPYTIVVARQIGRRLATAS